MTGLKSRLERIEKTFQPGQYIAVLSQEEWLLFCETGRLPPDMEILRTLPGCAHIPPPVVLVVMRGQRVVAPLAFLDMDVGEL